MWHTFVIPSIALLAYFCYILKYRHHDDTKCAIQGTFQKTKIHESNKLPNSRWQQTKETSEWISQKLTLMVNLNWDQIDSTLQSWWWRWLWENEFCNCKRRKWQDVNILLGFQWGITGVTTIHLLNSSLLLLRRRHRLILISSIGGTTFGHLLSW